MFTQSPTLGKSSYHKDDKIPDVHCKSWVLGINQRLIMKSFQIPQSHHV